MSPQHQFDPVAASSIAALNSTQRFQRNFRQTLGAPEPPGIENAFNQSRSVLQQASQFAPLNILGAPESPNLPGLGNGGGSQGLAGLPSPQQFIPGANGTGAQGGLPSPEQLLPGNMGGQMQTQPTRRAPSSNGNGGNGNNGASQTEQSSDPGRQSAESRS